MPVDEEGDDSSSSSTAQLLREVVCTVQRVMPLKESTPVITSLSEEAVFLATLHKTLVKVSFSPAIIVIDEN
jgi:hypothetical protein